MSLLNGRCDRCNKPVKSLRMSIFNTDMCCDPCLGKEKRHPMYAQAKLEEAMQCAKGNYNFPGIGKPDDL